MKGHINAVGTTSFDPLRLDLMFLIRTAPTVDRLGRLCRIGSRNAIDVQHQVIKQMQVSCPTARPATLTLTE